MPSKNDEGRPGAARASSSAASIPNPMPRFTLTLALATLALPALAQQPEGRGAVYAGVGYFASDDTYGDELDLGARVLTADLGAEAHLLRRPHVTGTLGATLRMAEAEYAPLSSSGFQPQHLDLYARLAGDFVSATAGFVVDLGPEDTFRGVAEGEDPEEDLHFFNSDVQHAVRLGVHGEAPAGAFRLHGAVDGFLTLP